jgi:two-component system, sporulation sensor kinase E
LDLNTNGTTTAPKGKTLQVDIIATSHVRCREYGLLPDVLPSPQTYLSDWKLARQRNKYSELLEVVNLFATRTIELLSGTGIVMFVTDEDANIIHSLGDEEMLQNLRNLNIKEGMKFDESYSGTNAVNLALDHGFPFHLVGGDHFHNVLHETSCCSAPFDFQNYYGLRGVVTIMTSIEQHSEYQLAFLINMVESVERELILRKESRQQNLLNHIVIETSQNGIIVTDKSGKIIEFNKTAEQIFSVKRRKYVGNSVFKLPEIGSIAYNVIKNGATIVGENVTLTHDLDSQTYCLVDAKRILDGKKDVIGSYIVLRDMTEQQNLVQQVITAEKLSAIGKMAAGLAHEIRNPLTSILGFVQLMRKSGNPKMSYINIMYDELIRMRGLVTDFVNASKPSSPERRRFFVNNLISDTVSFMESQAIMKNCQIIETLDGDNVEALLDYSQIKQVLINIVQNGIEAMEDGGEVQVITDFSSSSTHYKISITDNGSGMDEHQLKQISNPFFTTKEYGVGLGLSVCYRIVEAHGGRIEVASQKGAGTRFDIILPLDK